MLIFTVTDLALNRRGCIASEDIAVLRKFLFPKLFRLQIVYSLERRRAERGIGEGAEHVVERRLAIFDEGEKCAQNTLLVST